MGSRTVVLGISALAATTIALSAGGFLLIALNWPSAIEHPEWGFPGFQGAAALVIIGVGIPVVLRRPGNPIGWLMSVAAFLSAAQFVGHQYALHGLVVDPGSVPAPSLGTWVEEWIWIPILAMIAIYPFFLFPTGELISSKWRWPAAVAAPAVAVATLGLAFAPTTRVPGAVNPLAPDGSPQWLELPTVLAVAMVTAVLAVAAGSLVVRFRRASGIERQQLKWLAYAAVLIAAVLTVYVAGIASGGDVYGPMSTVLAATILFAPVAMAVAILRYGLYEIDILINRTLVYGSLTILLGAVYIGLVLGLQTLLSPVLGTETIAVAMSTLAVAALFGPARRRVQAAVDRRFYRSRYDAARTLSVFANRLRDEIDFAALTQALLATAERTVQPASASVWLRERERER
ncbi:MAG TPA: hypothetical protein VHK28_07875 [Candidatus Limnocylindria bacterium]|nr:hypothetical protein [Candidatus Limnocylindria bacterium]